MRAEHRYELNTMFGVGLDGNYFIFIRFRDDKWHVQEPVEVNKYSAERFLWALYNLGQKGKPFSSEYLAGDFGSESKLAQDGVRALYNAIIATDNPKAQIFFSQWKILFGEVCGYDVDNPSDKIKKLAEFYGVEHRKKFKAAELLFAVHSYYAIFMKLLASEIAAYFHKLPTPLQKMIQATSSNALKREMEDLEAGSIFRHLNITNFLEGDLFAWYVPVWSEPIEQLVRGMVARLDDYNPGTLSEDPAGSRDLLKKLYQQLFPKSVRHDLGEYYTPDWLAEHVLNELEYVGDPDKRLLDPACGSGTFLVMAINRIRRWYDENREQARFDEGDLCRKILSNVIGFDLNPLAVMAARTNYLIAIRDLVGHVDKIEIPIYLCDSIMTPSEYGGLFSSGLGKAKELKTAAAKFIIPTEIATHRDEVAKYAEQLELCVRNAYSPEEFLQRCRDAGLAITEEALHSDLYAKLVKLDKANKNGVWARIIKNSFAPVFVGRVDYVAGNPPWINWESLPSDYRNDTKHLWNDLKLIPRKKGKGFLAESTLDFCVLFFYVSAHNYLRDKGKIGFVITQSLFKTEQRGQGFRQLSLPGGTQLKVLHVSDMVAIQPFEGATNKTGTVAAIKGVPTESTFPYSVYMPVGRPEAIDDAPEMIEEQMLAFPVDDEPGAPWATVPKSQGFLLESVFGASKYEAQIGVDTMGANGVFWIRPIERKGEDCVVVANLGDVGKKKVTNRTGLVSRELVHLLVRGQNIDKWRYHAAQHILIPHTAKTAWRAIPEPELKSAAHCETYAFLFQFKKFLEGRPSYQDRRRGHPFYILTRVYEESFFPFRVVWKRMTSAMSACVVSEFADPIVGNCLVFGSDTTTFLGTHDKNEAHYVCGMMNSRIFNNAVKIYASVGRGFGGTHVLRRLHVPLYDEKDSLHRQIASTSLRCHEAALRDDIEGVLSGEREIDALTAKVWSIPDNTLAILQ